jgi:hypothetical protein
MLDLVSQNTGMHGFQDLHSNASSWCDTQGFSSYYSVPKKLLENLWYHNKYPNTDKIFDIV